MNTKSSRTYLTDSSSKKNLVKQLLSHNSTDSRLKITLCFPIFSDFTENEKSRIIYNNLLKELQNDLINQFPKREWTDLLNQLQELGNDLEFFRGNGNGILLFADSNFIYRIDAFHNVATYVHAGDQFLIKDIFVFDKIYQKPKYIIEIGKDRCFSWDTKNYDSVVLKDIPYNITDYYDDFDNDSNLNVGNYGGLDGSYHGHRTKDEEEKKAQKNYFQYLIKKIESLTSEEHITISLCGVQEVIDNFLSLTQDQSYIFSALKVPLSKLTKKEMRDIVEETFEKHLNHEIKGLHLELENAKSENKLVHDIQTINYNLDNRLIKKIIFFNTSEGYSIEQNQLIIACVKQNVEVIVLDNNPKTPTINAILY
ncbi:baeRF6 domain-containing protein [Lactococcus garvieae]|uniref:baeRF6 domain-containing protein n=1 Tax=Lactococcus garvieae TaxID=1363 RepID=UPI00288E173F|nr:hypothetical protein [Lactococcus garvieae]MDT2741902.1 hypothetical protein [Lactococcus garvieae]